VSQVVALPYRDPFNTGRLRPYLLLHVVGPSGASGDLWGIVDSGADSTCLPLDFAPLMGYGPGDLEQQPFQQAGGTATCYIAKQSSVAWVVGLDDRPFNVQPTFIDGASSVLWGRQDFFMQFGITFDEANQHFSLTVSPTRGKE